MVYWRHLVHPVRTISAIHFLFLRGSLCGFPPFYGNNDQQIFEKIMRADYDFPSPDWDGISNEGASPLPYIASV